MTPYQRGYRDALLSFAKELYKAARAHSDEARRLSGTHHVCAQSVIEGAKSEALAKAAEAARKTAEAPPDEVPHAPTPL